MWSSPRKRPQDIVNTASVDLKVWEDTVVSMEGKRSSGGADLTGAKTTAPDTGVSVSLKRKF